MTCREFGPVSARVRLMHGDAMAGLALAPCAAVLITDPPYRVTSGGAGRPGAFARGWMQEYANDGWPAGVGPEWPAWLPLAYRALAPRAHAYVMSNDRNLADAWAAASAAGFRFHRLLAWDKRAAVANRWFRQRLEFTLFMFKGAERRINDCGADTLWSQYQRDQTDHPTEKPVELMRHYIEQSTQPGDLVLDPFFGSGTTAVAALQSGRSFLGFEHDPRWFDVAAERCARATRRAGIVRNRDAVKTAQELLL